MQGEGPHVLVDAGRAGEVGLQRLRHLVKVPLQQLRLQAWQLRQVTYFLFPARDHTASRLLSRALQGMQIKQHVAAGSLHVAEHGICAGKALLRQRRLQTLT